MNIEGKRYLALNCIIHNHGFMPAFDNDYAQAAQAFGVKTDGPVRKVEEELNRVYETYEGSSVATEYGNVVAVLLRYFHTREYAFVAIPGQAPFYLDVVMDMARNGDFEEDLAKALVARSITDVTFVNSSGDIHISDGLLYVTRDEAEHLDEYMEDAFMRLYSGPFARTEEASEAIATIYNNRGYFDMRKLQTFSATKFRELVRAFTRLDFNPNLYADTLFYGPDLLNVYKATGYVLMKDSVYPNNLLCMVDIEGTTRVSVRSVPNAVIRSLLVSDLHDLSNVCCKNPRSDLTIREVC